MYGMCEHVGVCACACVPVCTCVCMHVCIGMQLQVLTSFCEDLVIAFLLLATYTTTHIM